jgi:streptogramin lyase
MIQMMMAYCGMPKVNLEWIPYVACKGGSIWVTVQTVGYYTEIDPRPGMTKTFKSQGRAPKGAYLAN